MEIIRKMDIIKYKRGEMNEEKDTIIVEYPFTIFLNDNEFITLLCTPKSLENLVVGFLSSEGIINSKDDIRSLQIYEDKGQAYVYIENNDSITFIGDKLSGKRTVTTACGKAKTISYSIIDFYGTEKDKIENTISITPKEILDLINTFNKKSELFIDTGGVHSCALCDKNSILIFEEDVGRHNALDKILGEAILNDINLNDKIVVTSGRISSEMAIKVIKRKIPVLVSRSAPTDIAIDIANRFNLTLIGFARGEKMNIYSDFSDLY